MSARVLVPFSVLALVLVGVSGPSRELVDPADVASTVEVLDLRRAGQTIEGHLVNRGDKELRDVRILVQLVYHWPKEMQPGPESPSRAIARTIEGPIPPGGRVPFVVELAARPEFSADQDRLPGRFEIRAAVLGWSETQRAPLPEAR